MEHTGQQEFAINCPNFNAANEGDEITIGVEVNVKEGKIRTLLVPRDKDDTVLTYLNGKSSTQNNVNEFIEWANILPAGTAKIDPRLVGTGPCIFLFRNFWFEKTGHYNVPKKNLTLKSDKIEVTINKDNADIEVIDKISKRTWKNRDMYSEYTIRDIISETSNSIEFAIIHKQLDYIVTMTLANDELNFSINCDPDRSSEIPSFPKDFVSQKGDRMIWPLGEGVSLPCDEPITFENEITREIASPQSSLSMPFVGITNGNASMMIVFDTPYDGMIYMWREAETKTYYLHHLFNLEKNRFSKKISIHLS